MIWWTWCGVWLHSAPWAELEHQLWVRPCLTSVSDLTNALLTEWTEFPHTQSRILWKVFPAVGCSASTCKCDDHLSTYFWPSSINIWICTYTQRRSLVFHAPRFRAPPIHLPSPTSGSALAQWGSPHFCLQLVSALTVHFISSTDHMGHSVVLQLQTVVHLFLGLLCYPANQVGYSLYL